MAGLSDRKHYANPVSYKQVHPKQYCGACKTVIREQTWWRLTTLAYHYKGWVYCGQCLFDKKYPVKDTEGNIYLLVPPK